MDVAGYIRSARSNDTRLNDCDAAIRRYAAKHNHHLLILLHDKGVSGVAPIRPELSEIRRMVKEGLITGVLTPSPQHLATSTTSAKEIYDSIVSDGGWVQFIADYE